MWKTIVNPPPRLRRSLARALTRGARQARSRARMTRALGRCLTVLTALAAWSAPSAALALDDEREGTPRTAAPDELSGRLIVRAGAEVVGPVGSVATGLAADDVSATGFGASASIGLGITRGAELSLAGGFAVLGGPARCDPCGGNTARVGLGFAYHLAQGIAIDPWARWGVGFRTTEVVGDGATSRVARELVPGRYHGIDFTQLTLGTMWSPAASFGFGPYVEMDLGTYASRPDGAETASIYAFFTAGLALQLAPGRSAFDVRSSVDTVAAAARSGAAPPSF